MKTQQGSHKECWKVQRKWNVIPVVAVVSGATLNGQPRGGGRGERRRLSEGRDGVLEGWRGPEGEPPQVVLYHIIRFVYVTRPLIGRVAGEPSYLTHFFSS